MNELLLFIRVTSLFNIADPFTNKSKTTNEWFNAAKHGDDTNANAIAYATEQTQARKIGYVIAEKTYRILDTDGSDSTKRYVETFMWTRKNGWVLKETKTVTVKVPAEVRNEVAASVGTHSVQEPVFSD